tara:strand:+ start:162 stop:380 length:219 start_codon:yes stop_codon:yes gene_type:complete
MNNTHKNYLIVLLSLALMVSVFVNVLQKHLIKRQSLFIDEQKSSYEEMLSNKDKELKGMHAMLGSSLAEKAN